MPPRSEKHLVGGMPLSVCVNRRTTGPCSLSGASGVWNGVMAGVMPAGVWGAAINNMGFAQLNHFIGTSACCCGTHIGCTFGTSSLFTRISNRPSRDCDGLRFVRRVGGSGGVVRRRMFQEKRGFFRGIQEGMSRRIGRGSADGRSFGHALGIQAARGLVVRDIISFNVIGSLGINRFCGGFGDE